MNYPYVNFLKEIQQDQHDPFHVEVVGICDCFERHKYNAEYYGFITVGSKTQVIPGLCIWSYVKLTTKGRWIIFKNSQHPKLSFIKRIWKWLTK